MSRRDRRTSGPGPGALLGLAVAALLLAACGEQPPEGEPTVTTRAGALTWTLSVEPDPPRQQGNTLWLDLEDARGEPVTGADVRLRTRMPAMGAMPEMRGTGEVSEAGDGRYQIELDFSMAGTWSLLLEVTTADARAEAEYTLTVGRPGLRETDVRASRPTGPETSRLPDAALAPLRDALEGYEQMRALLAADSTDGLAAAAGRLTQGLERAHRRWLEEAAAAGRSLAAAADLAAARGAFGEVSRFLVALAAVDPRLAEGWQVFECGMTETFPKWMQRGKEISNPYMGRDMPRCGAPADWSVPPPRSRSEIDAHVEHAHEGDLSHYTCAMHPSVRAQEAGTCPICGMDLVPVTREEVTSGVIRVDAARRQAIGVRTTRVARRPLTATIRAVGSVRYDERRLSEVSVKYEGWIGRLHVDETGQAVRRGEPLFTLYSPELLTTQQELLIAVRAQQSARGSAAPGRADYLLAAARRRLGLWDLSEAQIDAIARTGEPLEYVPILSPVSGHVVEKHVVGGSAVKPGQTLYRIAGLDAVWIDAEVYESELAQVRLGQPAEVSLPYLPGRIFHGRVDFIHPYLESSTRTATVRIELPNADLALMPDMYADVLLQADLGERLVVPEEAVIYAGPRRLVFLDLGEGRLAPREIEIGARANEGFEVLSGLESGDRVVTSGNFLIAAESRLKSATETW